MDQETTDKLVEYLALVLCRAYKRTERDEQGKETVHIRGGMDHLRDVDSISSAHGAELNCLFQGNRLRVTLEVLP